MINGVSDFGELNKRAGYAVFPDRISTQGHPSGVDQVGGGDLTVKGDYLWTGDYLRYSQTRCDYFIAFFEKTSATISSIYPRYKSE